MKNTFSSKWSLAAWHMVALLSSVPAGADGGGPGGGSLEGDAPVAEVQILASFPATTPLGAALHHWTATAGFVAWGEKIKAAAVPGMQGTQAWVECLVEEVSMRVEYKLVLKDCLLKSGSYVVDEGVFGLQVPYDELPQITALDLLKELGKPKESAPLSK